MHRLQSILIIKSFLQQLLFFHARGETMLSIPARDGHLVPHKQWHRTLKEL